MNVWPQQSALSGWLVLCWVLQWPELRLFKTNLFRPSEAVQPIASQTRLPMKHQSRLEWPSPLGLARLPALGPGQQLPTSSATGAISLAGPPVSHWAVGQPD